MFGPILGPIAFAADPIVVRPGDTLTAISSRHGVSISEIVEINDLVDPNRIYAGQRLDLSPDAEAAPARGASSVAAPAAPVAQRVHVITAGEHLTGIGRRYGISVATLVAANGIANPSRIYVGQRLIVPSATPAAPTPEPAAAGASSKPAPSASVHVVAAGENLTGIARRHGVSVAAIVTANGIANASRIYAGQRLSIPGSTPAAVSRPAMPASMAALVAAREPMRQLIVAEAARAKVPAALALAVAWQESGWRQGVTSSAGAIGVMQLMPATADWIGDAMLGATVDPRDVRHNVRAGVRLLAHYLDRYDGNRSLVLAAYYQGQAATDRHGVFAVSRPYIASILALERIFGG